MDDPVSDDEKSPGESGAPSGGLQQTPADSASTPAPQTQSDARPPAQAVKVDLGELRELIEGLPEKTALFIREAVSTPKRTVASKDSSHKDSNAPTEQIDTPKPAAKSKRGWLARGLFGD